MFGSDSNLSFQNFKAFPMVFVTATIRTIDGKDTNSPLTGDAPYLHTDYSMVCMDISPFQYSRMRGEVG